MNFLILDQGIFVECSNGLSRNGKHEVRYYTNWEKSQPQHSDFAPGYNFENLQKVEKFWENVEWADCIVNFDCFDQDSIDFIKKIYPNKSVFGSGAGDVIENDRWYLKKLLQQVGLPLHKAYRVIGLTKLREFLKTHPKVFIKTNKFRQDCESFFAKDYKFVEHRLNALSVKYGALSDTIEFIAEETLDTDVEVGFDGFFDGNEFLETCLLAYEVHKEFYVGKVTKYAELPNCVKETMEKLKPTLRKMDYRGAISTEEKVFSQDKHYLLDICARLQSPASVGYSKWFKNWPEVVYKIGKKEKVEIKCDYKYVGAVFLDSEVAQNESVYLDIDKKDKDKVKFVSACQHNGDYYAVKGCKTVAVPIGEGNTWQEVVKALKANSELIDCDGLSKDNISYLDKIEEVIKKGESVGISF